VTGDSTSVSGTLDLVGVEEPFAGVHVATVCSR
jgi:hypothetical protein